METTKLANDWEDSNVYQDETGEVYCYTVDKETGELVPTPIENMPHTRRLDYLGDEISRLIDMANQIMDAGKVHAEEIKARTEFAYGKVISRAEFLQEMAESIIKDLADKGECPLNKQKKPVYQIPAVGKFRYRGLPQKVDRSAWDAFSEKEKEEIKDTNALPIRIKWEPDLRRIKEQLKLDLVVPGFNLTKPADKFEFVAEKG